MPSIPDPDSEPGPDPRRNGRGLGHLLSASTGGMIRLIRRLGWVYALGWGTALLLLYVFADLTEDVLEGEFTALNHSVLTLLHAHAGKGLDRLALALSALGGVKGTLLVAAAVVTLLAVHKRLIDAATMIILLAGGGALTFILKQLFRQPRPMLFESLAPETSFSFPSGHSLMSVCLYGYLSLLLLFERPKATWPAALALLILPLGIIWSRLYLGVHWFTDVIAGALVAGFWLTVCMMLRHAALRYRS